MDSLKLGHLQDFVFTGAFTNILDSMASQLRARSADINISDCMVLWKRPEGRVVAVQRLRDEQNDITPEYVEFVEHFNAKTSTLSCDDQYSISQLTLPLYFDVNVSKYPNAGEYDDYFVQGFNDVLSGKSDLE